MAEKSFPFDAVNVDGAPDRVFYSADFASMFEKFFVNGVYPNPSDCLQVMASSGMVVKVRPGSGYIKGRVYTNDADIDIAINTANANYNRKDIIVLRLDLTDRGVKVLYRPGTAAANPIAPELVRTDDIHDLKLAEVFVGSGASVIQQSNITDSRLDNTVCGYVDNTIKNVDTTTIFNQYQDFWSTIYQQMGANIGQFSSGFNMYGVATGTGTYAVDIPGAILVEGANFKIKFVNGYTGQSSLNVNGQGAKNITRADGTAFNIKAGSVQNLIYVNGNFLPVGEGGCGNASADMVLPGYTFSNDEGFFAGSMPSNGNANTSIANGVLKKGYTDGGAIANAKTENIAYGINIAGVIGSAKIYNVATGTIKTTSGVFEKFTNCTDSNPTGNTTVRAVSVNGLGFTPNLVVLLWTPYFKTPAVYDLRSGYNCFGMNGAYGKVLDYAQTSYSAYMRSGGFRLPATPDSSSTSNLDYVWIAYELK